jgi:hypothetical protein
VQEEGSKGLEELLAREKEESLPEFKRKRPKYYYYYEWMKERIAEHCGALPEPVLDKLLTVEAGELDTLLTYPRGIQAKVHSRCGCNFLTPPVRSPVSSPQYLLRKSCRKSP